ncbi:MAG: AHH domain-containing protein [Puniceicoccales bacterium]|jgi:hypothetical protein|nr:AHH domain-containing protein [Puniceicoccales bacterium]
MSKTSFTHKSNQSAFRNVTGAGESTRAFGRLLGSTKKSDRLLFSPKNRDFESICSTPHQNRSPNAETFTPENTRNLCLSPNENRGNDQEIASNSCICLTPQHRHRQDDQEITPDSVKAIKASFQSHHIIPKTMWKQEIGAELENLGIARDDKLNTVLLPTVPVCPEEISAFLTPSSNRTLGDRAQNSSLHVGSHLKKYSEYISTGLGSIIGGDTPNSLEKKMQVMDFIEQTREKLLSGSLKLNNVPKKIRSVPYVNNKEFKYIDEFFQVHHLIPREIFEETRSNASRLLSAIGLEDPHFTENLSSLPKSPYLPSAVKIMKTPMKHRKASGRSTHYGSHPKYTKLIRNKLNLIYRSYRDSCEGIGRQINRAKLRAKTNIFLMLQNVKKELYSGTLQLN